jgi:hypothetical protein
MGLSSDIRNPEALMPTSGDNASPEKTAARPTNGQNAAPEGAVSRAIAALTAIWPNADMPRVSSASASDADVCDRGPDHGNRMVVVADRDYSAATDSQSPPTPSPIRSTT